MARTETTPTRKQSPAAVHPVGTPAPAVDTQDAPAPVLTSKDIEAAAAANPANGKPVILSGVKYTTFATDAGKRIAPVDACKVALTFAVGQPTAKAQRLCNALTAANGGKLRTVKRLTITAALVALIAKQGANVLYAKANDLSFSADMKPTDPDAVAVAAACKITARDAAAKACAVADDVMREYDRARLLQSLKGFDAETLRACGIDPESLHK